MSFVGIRDGRQRRLIIIGCKKTVWIHERDFNDSSRRLTCAMRIDGIYTSPPINRHNPCLASLRHPVSTDLFFVNRNRTGRFVVLFVLRSGRSLFIGRSSKRAGTAGTVRLNGRTIRGRRPRHSGGSPGPRATNDRQCAIQPYYTAAVHTYTYIIKP